MSETQQILQRVEKPNSYEFGKAGNRWKLFFSDAKELKALMNELVKEGLSCFPDEK